MLAATDEAILAFAVQESAVIVPADSDFAMMLALTGAVTPSLILLRSADRLPPDQQCALILDNVDTFAADLDSGASSR